MSFVSGTVEVIVATLLVYFLFDTHVRENTNTCVCTKNHILKTTNTQKTHSQKSSCIQIQNTNTTITMHLITTYANCIQIQNTNTAITMHLIATYANCIQIQNTNTTITMHLIATYALSATVLSISAKSRHRLLWYCAFCSNVSVSSTP